MSPTNLSFVVVICHGSYHTPQPYQPFLAALEESGIEAHCPQLPSSDLHKMNVGDVSEPDYDREPPPNGYPQPADDVKVVRKILDHLIVDTNKHVLLLGHSSGAFTATMAAIPELQAHMRKRKGAGGGIIGIFYECGFLIPVGESVHSFFQPKDGSAAVIPPYCQFHKFKEANHVGFQKHGFKGVASAKNGAQYFFNGLDEATANHYEKTLTASPPFTTVLDNDPYTAIPCAYLITEDDLALPATYQESMLNMQVSRPGAKPFAPLDLD
ncbi:MAG: hypothetical protein L6R39_003301 [Caloplaca ligustica]|nr:MAG: hypothetical protein L6R39_003301 [Caloplaca ligustica]